MEARGLEVVQVPYVSILTKLQLNKGMSFWNYSIEKEVMVCYILAKLNEIFPVMRCSCVSFGERAYKNDGDRIHV